MKFYKILTEVLYGENLMEQISNKSMSLIDWWLVITAILSAICILIFLIMNITKLL